MTTTPSPTRPDSPPFEALYYVPKTAKSVIDVGCNDGDAVADLAAAGYELVAGVDINPAAIEAAHRRFGDRPDMQFRHASGDELPFDTASFDAAVCTEVIEHVPAELRRGLFEEIHRVLKPGGRLVLTTPFRGLFHWSDPANARLVLPGLFRAANRLVGGHGRDAGYVGQKHGVVWHHHFRLSELEDLARGLFGFNAVRYRGALVTPFVEWARWPLYRAGLYQAPPTRFLQWMHRTEYRIPMPRPLAYNVLVSMDRL